VKVGKASYVLHGNQDINPDTAKQVLVSLGNSINYFHLNQEDPMENIQNIKRSYRIDNVTLNWAKLDKPVNPYGQLQWEMQIATTDKALAESLSENHFRVQEKESGIFTVSLKRKAIKVDGEPNKPVTVVGSDLAPLTGSIGNGSVGNVIVWQNYYDKAGRQGVVSTLTGVQVTDLKVYNSSTAGFDVVSSNPTTATADAIEDAEDAPMF